MNGKKALAFSGGKDSWACLWLLKDQLAEITVIWVNTGKNYPEMLETINKARALCPNFVEIVSDRVGQNARNGIPSDVVPINWTPLGQQVTHKKDVMVQAYTFCCHENIGMQLHTYCMNNGITHLYRGQRNDEGHKSSARNGDTFDGITYLQPIEDWSAEKVISFNAKHMDLPDHFEFNHSSMDCYDCTAFTAESKDRIAYTKLNHPDLYQEYRVRKDALTGAIREALAVE